MKREQGVGEEDDRRQRGIPTCGGAQRECASPGEDESSVEREVDRPARQAGADHGDQHTAGEGMEEREEGDVDGEPDERGRGEGEQLAPHGQGVP